MSSGLLINYVAMKFVPSKILQKNSFGPASLIIIFTIMFVDIKGNVRTSNTTLGRDARTCNIHL